MEDNWDYFAVYNADGSLEGELAYLFGKLRGTRHCALCDISHGMNPLGKARWRRAQGEAARVVWVHKDEQPVELAKFTGDDLPQVVARGPSGFHTLLNREALDGFGGDYERFEKGFAESLTALHSDGA